MLSRGEGETVYLVDNAVTFKALSHDTGGAYGLIETVNSGNGPPPALSHEEVNGDDHTAIAG